MNISPECLDQKWEKALENTISVTPEYGKIPYFNPVETGKIQVKEYPVLDGKSKLSHLVNELYIDFSNYGLSGDALDYMVVSVQEAAQNAQVHAYKFQPADSEGNNKILIGAIFAPNYLIVDVTAKSHIDINAVRKIAEGYNLMNMKSGGMGFYMMVQSCDTVYLNQNEEYAGVFLIMLKDKSFERMRSNPS